MLVSALILSLELNFVDFLYDEDDHTTPHRSKDHFSKSVVCMEGMVKSLDGLLRILLPEFNPKNS